MGNHADRMTSLGLYIPAKRGINHPEATSRWKIATVMIQQTTIKMWKSQNATWAVLNSTTGCHYCAERCSQLTPPDTGVPTVSCGTLQWAVQATMSLQSMFWTTSDKWLCQCSCAYLFLVLMDLFLLAPAQDLQSSYMYICKDVNNEVND